MNAAELEVIREGLAQRASARLPWRALLTPNLLLICMMYFCMAYTLYFNQTLFSHGNFTASRLQKEVGYLTSSSFDYVRPELQRHGDLEMVIVLMGRLRSHGTGAARQRSLLAQRGSVTDVVDWLAAATRGAA